MENALSIGLLMISNSITDGAEKAMVARWAEEYNAYTDRNRKSKEVLRQIGEGYDTMNELVFVTGFNITTLRRIINRLLSQKKIRQMRIKNTGTQPILKFELI